MTRILTNEEIEAHLSIEEYLPQAEEMFEELADERASITEAELTYTAVPDPPEGTVDPVYHMMRNMGGAIQEFGVSGLRINSDVVHWPETDGTKTREKIPAADGQFSGFVVIFDINTGEPLLVFPDGYVQTYHVATGIALGAKHLAREDASTLGMLGSGHQARAHLPALAAVRDLDHVKVYSPTRENREAYAEEMAEEVPVTIEAVDSARAAFEGVDIVNCATSALSSVFETEWLEPGTHVGYIKTNEPPEDFFDSLDTFVIPYPKGDRLVRDFSGHVTEERIKPATWYHHVIEGETEVPEVGVRDEPLDMMDHIEEVPRLSEVIAGDARGRSSPDDVTGVYQAPRGVDFVSVGYALHEIAEREDLGRQLPSGTFTQDYTP